MVEGPEVLGSELGPMRAGPDVVGGIASLAACVLHEAGFALVHVPGLAVNRARQGTSGGEHRSDPADAAVIRSPPGMGAILTAEFIAEAGGIRRFPTADRLAAAAGLAPILKQSGEVRHLTRARGGNKALKRVFYQSALCSLACPGSTALYARKRAEGERHHQALIALARRRIDVLHAILRTREPDQADFRRAA